MAKVTKKTTKKEVDLSKKTVAELNAELITTQTDLVEAKRSHAARELVSTVRIKDLRRQVARIKTVLSHKVKEETK
ncbi:MAG: 50S ribosomal protein L29 [Candidatus Saccharibacteria bacterium]|nr:50S ribosomal protein L29 [Candidatus Saccharibacteria bacterium]